MMLFSKGGHFTLGPKVEKNHKFWFVYYVMCVLKIPFCLNVGKFISYLHLWTFLGISWVTKESKRVKMVDFGLKYQNYQHWPEGLNNQNFCCRSMHTHLFTFENVTCYSILFSKHVLLMIYSYQVA